MCRSKHVEPLKTFGIINSITKLHLVGISTDSREWLGVDWIILALNTDKWLTLLKRALKFLLPYCGEFLD